MGLVSNFTDDLSLEIVWMGNSVFKGFLLNPLDLLYLNKLRAALDLVFVDQGCCLLRQSARGAD